MKQNNKRKSKIFIIERQEEKWNHTHDFGRIQQILVPPTIILNIKQSLKTLWGSGFQNAWIVMILCLNSNYYSFQLGSVSGNLRSFETYVPTLLTVFPPTLRLFLSLSSPHNLFFISLYFIQLSHAGIHNE